MTRQLSRPQAIILGVVVILGLGLATWVVLAVNERRGLGGDAVMVEAAFADVGGAEVGSRVRLQGIDAGEVMAVVPPRSPGAPVTLRLRLSGKVRHLITADARVQIASDNLFAGRYVKILPGSPGSPQVEDGACLASCPSTELMDAAVQTAAKTQSLMDAATKTAVKAQSVLDDVRPGKGAISMLLKDEKFARDLAQSVAKLNESAARLDALLQELQQGKGTLGMLLKDSTLYTEMLATMAEVKSALGQDIRRLVASVRQNSDAIKSLPVVRSYVVDAHKELVRPECTRLCKWFPANKLFEPGRAVLTADGRKHLDEAAGWLNEHKEPGSEVVIAAFAAPNQDAEVGQTLTQKQAEAVCHYLKTAHHIHSTGWWWWSTRQVRAIGVGTVHPTLPDADRLPPSRIELIVFVPAK